MLTVGYRMGILLEILRASHQSEYLTAFQRYLRIPAMPCDPE